MGVVLDEKRFPELIKQLYGVAGELQQMADGLHFTPDGHMVGSIGQALVSYYYGVELRETGGDGHNGRTNGRLIQIRATQNNAIALRQQPEHLIAIRLSDDGSFKEVYNGPGGPVWNLTKDKRPPKNGQFSISLASLQSLMESVPMADRIPRVR